LNHHSFVVEQKNSLWDFSLSYQVNDVGMTWFEVHRDETVRIEKRNFLETDFEERLEEYVR
jgi:hypothetical protein